MKVFIDTQIWVYAFKKPKREGFKDGDAFEEALQMHGNAVRFLEGALANHEIYVTTHQVAEIYHALAFRGIRMNARQASEIIDKVMRSAKTVLVEVRKRHYREALRLSSVSGIHVWDYLCVIPLKGLIEIVYTNDRHFLHPTLRNLVPRVENPIGKWITL